MTSAATDRISKVTVEYYDPSGVWPVLSRHLQSHLPLRNLHWKSQNRPLRSIDFLHVDLVPSVDAPTKAQESRHQIPGLRQTPYLKLFLLRCDDVDAYRESGRKSLREWLKANTPPSQSSSSSNAQENHDAYEWMILHVVYPNTSAASQPRYSKSSSKDEEPSGKTGSKLLGRSSNTILEKTKADFNASGKSAPDRVAQIRLQPDDIPREHLPAKKPGEVGHHETAQDRQNAWNDVVAKFKLLILSSFDLRVRQYEEDIKERGSQRSLPGWNFCTFFLLKEGLSMGLESVGLLDDALLGYDELSVELDSVLRDEANAMNAFLDETPELSDLLTASKTNGKVTSIWNSSDKPIDPRRKDYRALILNNNISVFDFKCYIFSRQIILLHRMGILHASEVEKMQSDKTKAAQQNEGNEDLACLAELCQRAASFITSDSRALRADLLHAAQSNSLEDAEKTIDEIACSWTYAVAGQILDETVTNSFTAALKQSNKVLKPLPSPNKQKSGHSHRTSTAVGTSALRPPYEQVPEDAQVTFDRLKQGGRASPTTTAGEASGYEFEELAARRADLILLQRRTLEKLGQMCDWFAGIAALRKGITTSKEDMKDIDLDRSEEEDTSETIEDEGRKPVEIGPGVCLEDLRESLQSKRHFTKAYETLTSLALNHYFAATRPNAIEELFADLAIINFGNGDMVGAAGFFARITPLYAERQWYLIEESLLKLHAQCLKTLHRRDDYIQILLRILENSVNRQRSSLASTRNNHKAMVDAQRRPPSVLDTDGLIEELSLAAKDLPYELTVPMFALFDKVVVEPYIHHFDDKDGFSISIKFRHLLPENITFDTAKLQMSNYGEAQRQEIVLTAKNVEVKRGTCSVVASTNVTTRGIFQVDHFSLQAGNLIFAVKAAVESDKSQQIAVEKRQPLSEQQMPQVLCYLSNDALYASIQPSPNVHLDKPRMLDLRIESGRNAISTADIKVRAASAGLRLRTAETKLAATDQSGAKLETSTAPGAIGVLVQIKNIKQHSIIHMFIPYDMERDMPTVTLRLEISYQTSTGDFIYTSVKTIPISLPVEVNVRDFFRSTFIRSTFNIKPAGASPVNILGIDLSDTDLFEVRSSSVQAAPMLVFPDQPAQKSYRILPRGDEPRKPAEKETSLDLSIWYQCLDERVTSSIRSCLISQLDDSELGQFSRLLGNYLDVQVRRWLTAAQLSQIGVLKEIKLPSFAEIGWQSLLPRFPRLHREKVQVWLEKWHNNNSVLALGLVDGIDEPVENEEGIRRLDITVPVPRLPVLHTAKLLLQKNASQILATGALVSAQLSIFHTRRWDSADVYDSLTQDTDGALDFVFELDAPPDTWLIAGQRRTRFSAKEDEVKTWQILLIPLKPGKILLPSVEVRPAGKGMDELSCDTFYESMGETALVIDDVGSTTITLQDTPMGTEPLLLGFKSRA